MNFISESGFKLAAELTAEEGSVAWSRTLQDLMLLLRSHLLRQSPRGSRGLATLTNVPGTKDYRSITPPYDKLIANIERIRKHTQRPLTLAEKILYSHLYNAERTLSAGPIRRGESYLQLS